MKGKNKHVEVNKLLRGLFSTDSKVKPFQLKEIFFNRLEDLSITKNQACKILAIEHKSLDSILDGDSKKIDFVSILKLSDFLGITANSLIEKYFNLVVGTFNEEIELAKRRSFIVDNFDLPQLKKIGFIDSINDFESIEKKIKEFFGYDNVFQFGKHRITAALSSGKRKSETKSLNFWFDAVSASLDKTPNPYNYDREGLIDFFPKIRSYSTNVDKGLVYVAQKLFTLGITLVVVPKFNANLHLRGCTFEHLGKPCIALTKYTKFYPTIWFALIHELFHVLYDWEAIQNEGKHFSLDQEEVDAHHVTKVLADYEVNENEANDFAQQYLFSKEKLDDIVPHINEPLFIEKYARENNVHVSFIYNFYLWQHGTSRDYGRFNKYFPKKEYEALLNEFNVESYLNFKPVSEISRKRNMKLKYNAI